MAIFIFYTCHFDASLGRRKNRELLEYLITLPISISSIVLGKFFAAWVFTIISLFLTFPLWITVNYLGEPDNGVILASYIGSILMAGGYIAIGSCISSLTSNQVIAFVVSASISFLFTVSGLTNSIRFFSSWGGQTITDAVASFSFLTNYLELIKGFIDFRSLLYFFTLISFFLVYKYFDC